MNSQHTNTKTSKDLKRQVLNDIERVKDDIQEIRDRITPGQFIDDALFFRRSNASPREAFDHLKNNPIGTTFLTLGTLMLMEDENQNSFERLALDKAGVARTRLGEAVQKAKGNLAPRFKKEELGPHFDATGMIDEERPKTLRGRIQGARSALSGVAQSVRSRFSSAADDLKVRGEVAFETSRNLDPLIYVALGAGLGSITGASLPVSQTEVDQIDSHFSDRMTKFASELQEALTKSVNIFKNECAGGIKDFDLKLFKIF